MTTSNQDPNQAGESNASGQPMSDADALTGLPVPTEGDPTDVMGDLPPTTTMPPSEGEITATTTTEYPTTTTTTVPEKPSGNLSAARRRRLAAYAAVAVIGAPGLAYGTSQPPRADSDQPHPPTK